MASKLFNQYLLLTKKNTEFQIVVENMRLEIDNNPTCSVGCVGKAARLEQELGVLQYQVQERMNRFHDVCKEVFPLQAVDEEGGT